MYKDFKWFTVHVNAYQLNNWAFGCDYWEIFDYPIMERKARVFQLNFIFFNVTFTRWYTREYFPGI